MAGLSPTTFSMEYTALKEHLCNISKEWFGLVLILTHGNSENECNRRCNYDNHETYEEQFVNSFTSCQVISPE